MITAHIGEYLPEVLHYFLHIVFPFILARILFPGDWKRAGIIMLVTLAVDADHLLASPVFDPQRCSIGFHPLHTWPAISVYFLALFHKKTRYAGTGLLLHMSADLIDCFLH